MFLSGRGFIFRSTASNWPRFNLSGAVAQLGERLICIQEVAGSIPTSSTSVAAKTWRSRDGLAKLVPAKAGSKRTNGTVPRGVELIDGNRQCAGGTFVPGL